MRATFALGRIAGVKVGVNWSVLIIFALIAAGLSAGRFPSAYPGYPAWAYAVAGVTTAVAFFGGLLAHELSHAIVAIRHGVPVEGITLWMLGGVAQLRGEARDPGAEMRIAGVGPLVSLIIGFAFGAVVVVMAAAGSTGLVFGTVVWLTVINIVLAVFNVLPAAPLDGGRLLHAALWRWRGDRVWAAVVAARSGRALGTALIILGLWQLVAGAGVGGLWLALIGWFLVSAAYFEEQQARLGDALRGVRAVDVMSPRPQSLPGSITVADFIDEHLWRARHTAFPLIEGDHPVGLITLDRIKQVPADRRAFTRLIEVAHSADELIVAAPREPLIDVLARLDEHASGRALVVDDEGRLVGIISPSDVSRAIQQAALRESQYIQAKPAP